MSLCLVRKIKPGWMSTLTPRLTPGSSLQAQEQSSPLADDNSIIPAGSFHHCHFSSELWLMFHRSSTFSFFSSPQEQGERGRRGQGAAEARLMTKGEADGDRSIGKQTASSSGLLICPRVTPPSITAHYHGCIWGHRWRSSPMKLSSVRKENSVSELF